MRDWGRPPAVALPSTEPLRASGYELVARLGEGGYGEVWKATKNGFPVALKFVKLTGRAMAAKAAALEIIREIQHIHLLPLVTAWREGGRLIIEMKLADRTLWELFE